MPIIKPTASTGETENAYNGGMLWQRLLLVCDDCNGKRKLIGVLGEREYRKFLLQQHGESVMDYANQNFECSTPETVETDIMKTTHNELPVVDDDGNYLYVVPKAWPSIRSFEKAQYFEMNWWENHYSHLTNVGCTINNYLDRYAKTLTAEEIDYLRDSLFSAAKDKCCMEIGAGPLLGIMPVFDQARRLIIIEPLGEKYRDLRKDYNIHIDNEADIEIVAKSAEEYVAELSGIVDGIMISENTLDHSPEWHWVLSNMSSYAAKDSLLLFSTDVNHQYPNPQGHYNITCFPDRLKRLIENLGYTVLIYRASVRTEWPGEHTFVIILARKN